MNHTWARRGSRTEQKYSNKVLIGNWAEERLQFTREPQTASGSGLADRRPHWDVRPDVSERRSFLLRAEVSLLPARCHETCESGLFFPQILATSA
ncbi:hypothetical protein EYF80_030201 [Liparis tanakae]|uniref:Uncharacterized protein n=1 Tax=Liparis tanakae TaxID=230148 RepID=A0A4Z2H1U9_9TELE|nr:hypothetical protein EYF80_030201 [Liparis tanakae]